MSSTARGAVRADRDFYVTPAWAVLAIAPHVRLAGVVVDPCAGDGAILLALREHDPALDVRGIEIDAARATLAGAVCADALAYPWQAGAVVMNPPFALAQAFVERACASTLGDVAVLMRLGMLAGQKRTAFWRGHPADVFVLSRRPSFTGGGTDSADYAWFLFGPGRGGRWARLDV